MAWVLWLLVPVLAPVVAAVVVWLRARPQHPVDAEDAMRQHQAYLAALVTPARGMLRTEPAEASD